MKALITGTSSGLGKDMAKILSQKGYDLILTARSEERMQELKKELNTDVKIIPLDLSVPENCFELYEKTKDEDIDILINNAGYGIFGEFSKIPIEKELNMIDLNIKAVHILTKLFLKDFLEKDKGYIMNVSSSAGMLPAGPLLSSYYSSKNYISCLTLSVCEEIRKSGKNVKLSMLCPGPVDTNFNKRAGGVFTLKSYKSEKVAQYAIDKLLKGKTIIIPGVSVKIGLFFARFASRKFASKIIHGFQIKKTV